MEEVCDYKCVESEKCLVNDYVCDTIPDCPKGDDETLAKCGKCPSSSAHHRNLNDRENPRFTSSW